MHEYKNSTVHTLNIPDWGVVKRSVWDKTDEYKSLTLLLALQNSTFSSLAGKYFSFILFVLQNKISIESRNGSVLKMSYPNHVM